MKQILKTLFKADNLKCDLTDNCCPQAVLTECDGVHEGDTTHSLHMQVAQCINLL